MGKFYADPCKIHKEEQVLKIDSRERKKKPVIDLVFPTSILVLVFFLEQIGQLSRTTSICMYVCGMGSYHYKIYSS